MKRHASVTLLFCSLTIALAMPGCQSAKPAPRPAAAPPAPAPAPAPKAAQPPASAPEPASQPAQPPLPEKTVLGEDVLHFGAGSVLPPRAQTAVRQVAERMRAQAGSYYLVITGYTAAGGPRNRAILLSHQRAEAVAKVFLRAGFAADHVTVCGLGPADPVASNGNAKGRMQNRRVELQFRVN